MVSWSMVSWSMVSWSMVSWSMVSWSMVSWSMVSWSMVSWSMVSWSMLRSIKPRSYRAHGAQLFCNGIFWMTRSGAPRARFIGCPMRGPKFDLEVCGELGSAFAEWYCQVLDKRDLFNERTFSSPSRPACVRAAPRSASNRLSVRCASDSPRPRRAFSFRPCRQSCRDNSRAR
jgi:hypothetical protein